MPGDTFCLCILARFRARRPCERKAKGWATDGIGRAGDIAPHTLHFLLERFVLLRLNEGDGGRRGI